MKRLKIAILLILIISISTCLLGCEQIHGDIKDETDTECQHVWTFLEYVLGEEPTCYEAGKGIFQCELCGAKEIQDVDKLEHTYTDATCLVGPYCINCYQTFEELVYGGEPLGHNFVDGICTRCGVIDISQCLFNFTIPEGMIKYVDGKNESDAAIESIQIVEEGGIGEELGQTFLALKLNYVCEKYIADNTLKELAKTHEIFSEEVDGVTRYYYYQQELDSHGDPIEGGEEYMVYVDCPIGRWYADFVINYPDGTKSEELLAFELTSADDTYKEITVRLEDLGLEFNQIGTYNIEIKKSYTA